MCCKKSLFAKTKIIITTKILRNLKKWLVPECRTILTKTWNNLAKKSLQIN